MTVAPAPAAGAASAADTAGAVGALGAPPGRRTPPAVLGAVVLAWVASLAAQAGGAAEAVHHDALDALASPPAAVAAFVAAWVVMLAAMMLPSSVPMIRLFAAIAGGQPRPRHAVTAFVAGYAWVWTLFGLLAFAGDLALHEFAEATPAVASRPWLVPGVVLALAGAFQFTSLKDRCLDACRHPAAFLLPRYRQGARAAFAVGREHGRFCLGCCWALMLLMFAAGLADLRWMAALAMLMYYEKVGRHGPAVARAAGLALLVSSAVVLADPAWMPALFAA